MNNNTPGNQDEYEMQYQKLHDAKEKGIEQVINQVSKLKEVAKTGGQLFTEQGRKMDQMNNKLDTLETKASRANNKMENYLNRTSNCTLYIILGIELFVFVLLMSI